MSNKNYRNYNQNYNKNNNFKNEEFTESEVDAVETEEIVEAVEETVEETVEQPVVTKEEKPLYGTVSGCKKLNVRKNPTKAAEPVCVVAEGALLVINAKKSTDEWYNVYTEDGIEGYSMKQYVSVKQ